ncbi:MAG: ABC transporter ATP-binding protein, partial [Clostridia bacterium]|nr:ABC transporter ATP-binding protein [Clostridia bacterium]
LNVAKEKTCIVISHRIGLCKKADNIIVMEKGRIVGQGRHEYLVENNAKYRELWNAQSKWYE